VIATTLVATAPLGASANSATSIRFAFSGTVTAATPVVFAALGVVSGATIDGYYDFDPNTPHDPQSTGTYRNPITDVFIQVGSYTARGPIGACCDAITVTDLSYSVNIGLADTPDLLTFETLQIHLRAGAVPFFADDSLPTEPPDLSLVDPGGFAVSRFFGGTTQPEPPTRAGIDFTLDKLELVPFPVELDIKPGSDLNAINPNSHGVIRVAILGSDQFDVADIDLATLALGPDRAPPAHSVAGQPLDVNADGFEDLLAHFRVAEAGIESGDMETCLSGETLDGQSIEGCDAIHTVPR
jgi:hypothetical protein